MHLDDNLDVCLLHKTCLHKHNWKMQTEPERALKMFFFLPCFGLDSVEALTV